MPGLAGRIIVDRALELARRHPHAATLDVLDAAMEGYRDTHPDFDADGGQEWSDWLDPPSPFAALLRQAFGAHLDESDIEAESPRWQLDVVEAFGERYKLWQ